MNTFDIKTVSDAAFELSRKTVQNLTDANIRTLKDMVAFGDTVTKASSDIVKNYFPTNGYTEMSNMFSKFQTETIKSMNAWTENLNKSK